jgi:hypothetical protein
MYYILRVDRDEAVITAFVGINNEVAKGHFVSVADSLCSLGGKNETLLPISTT